MTGKPDENASMNGQPLRMIPDTIPGVVCQFNARRTGERGPGRTLAGTTGTGDSIIDNDGRVPDANPDYHCLTVHRTWEKFLRERVAKRAAGFGDKKNTEAIVLNAGIIIRKPGGYIDRHC
ncbi:MAG: hypothetical protein Q7U51_08590 [Methanoregula sp.]|nr:hypothetical protein [Methanoregula sp.]